MKKKLTLLIALSMIFVIAIGAFMAPFVIAETKNEINKTEEGDIEPPSPMAITTSTTITTATTIATTRSLEKYPEAKLIWDTMRSWGWSPETCAGIIGNMMAEVGGKTLDLSDWDSNGGCGYGLIQWTDGRRATIKKRYGAYPTIEEQLLFMKDELFGTNNTTKQVSQEVLDIILNKNGSQTPETVAYAFACYYERCHQNYRWMRRDLARKAYDYFI